MSNRIVAGIDYSMSSPAICIHRGDAWSLRNCTFYFLTSKKKHVIKNGTFFGDQHKPFFSQEERFDNISEWAVSCIPRGSSIFIEGYSYASTGVVFDIAENTGLLKHKLWEIAQPVTVFSPPSIKKFATGKGNANKEAMYAAFSQETNQRFDAILDCKIGNSPLSDVVDAYYVAKLGFTGLCVKKG